MKTLRFRQLFLLMMYVLLHQQLIAQVETFSPPIVASANSFTLSGAGWKVDAHPRKIADVNGDGRADIIGFAETEVSVALGQANGTFSTPFVGLSGEFTIPQGWQVAKHLRTIADINGDNRADIIGFGETAVIAALGQADGTFGQPYVLLENTFTVSDGWVANKNPREVADVNGDGLVDIIGVGSTGVKVALGKADGTFDAPYTATTELGVNSDEFPWGDQHRVTVADVNGDSRTDIVFLYQADLSVFLAKANGTFVPSGPVGINYGIQEVEDNWRNDDLRIMGDVNGDSWSDLVLFGKKHVGVALSKGDGTFEIPHTVLVNAFTSDGGGWSVDNYPRTAADVNGDGKADLIGFGDQEIKVALATSTKAVDAATRWGNDKFMLFKGPLCALYTKGTTQPDPGFPKPIADYITGLPTSFHTGVDAASALWAEGVLFFRGDKVAEINLQTKVGEERFVPSDQITNIDAAILNDQDVYLLKDGQYQTLSNSRYPSEELKMIKDKWQGAPTAFQNNIDAAINWGDRKTMLFSGQNYARFDQKTEVMDEGYPAPILGKPHFPELNTGLGIQMQEITPGLAYPRIRNTEKRTYLHHNNGSVEMALSWENPEDVDWIFDTKPGTRLAHIRNVKTGQYLYFDSVSRSPKVGTLSSISNNSHIWFMESVDGTNECYLYNIRAQQYLHLKDDSQLAMAELPTAKHSMWAVKSPAYFKMTNHNNLYLSQHKESTNGPWTLTAPTDLSTDWYFDPVYLSDRPFWHIINRKTGHYLQRNIHNDGFEIRPVSETILAGSASNEGLWWEIEDTPGQKKYIKNRDYYLSTHGVTPFLRTGDPKDFGGRWEFKVFAKETDLKYYFPDAGYYRTKDQLEVALNLEGITLERPTTQEGGSSNCELFEVDLKAEDGGTADIKSAVLVCEIQGTDERPDINVSVLYFDCSSDDYRRVNGECEVGLAKGKATFTLGNGEKFTIEIKGPSAAVCASATPERICYEAGASLAEVSFELVDKKGSGVGISAGGGIGTGLPISTTKDGDISSASFGIKKIFTVNVMIHKDHGGDIFFGVTTAAANVLERGFITHNFVPRVVPLGLSNSLDPSLSNVIVQATSFTPMGVFVSSGANLLENVFFTGPIAEEMAKVPVLKEVIDFFNKWFW